MRPYKYHPEIDHTLNSVHYKIVEYNNGFLWLDLVHIFDIRTFENVIV